MTTETRKTNCHYCGYLCAFDATVEDGRVIDFTPDATRYPYDASVSARCPRWRLNLEKLYDEDTRVNYPLKRIGPRGGGGFIRVSWDEALDDIATRLRLLIDAHGPWTVASAIGGPHAVYWPLHRFMSFIDSPNNMGIGPICWNPRIWMDTMTYGWSVECDFRPDLTECLMLWGTNPAESDNSLFWRNIADYARNGGKLIVVDTRLSMTAAKATLWLAPFPGTDLVLAYALARVIIEEDLYDHDFVEKWCYGFDELVERCKEWTPEKAGEVCWIEPEKIVEAARLYANAKPATIQWGLKVDQTTNATATANAINALWSITGNVDVPGGNIIIRNAYQQNLSYGYSYRDLTPEVQAKRLGSEFPLMSRAGYSSSAHADSVLKTIETADPYPIRMVWMTSTNPIANMGADAPRLYRALRSVDFVVVNDLFMTPTAVAFADLVLPAAMSPERNSQRCWWVPHRTMVKVTQHEECVGDDELALMVGKRLHPENFPWEDGIEWIDHILQYETDDKLPYKTLEEGKKQVWSYPDFEYRKYEKGLLRFDGGPGFNTPTGRIELYNTNMMLWGYDALPEFKEPSCSPYESPELYEKYPFVLTTGARSFEFFHSEHRQAGTTSREMHPNPMFEMNPAAAKNLGLEEGDWCWIENQRGRCRQKLRFNPSLDERVVRAEHGWWFPETEGAEPNLFGTFDSNINNLIPQCDNGVTGYGAPYKNQLCKVYKCTEENSKVMPSYHVTMEDGYSKDIDESNGDVKVGKTYER